MSNQTRRSLLGSIGALGIAGLAGCAANTNPESTATRTPLNTAATGEAASETVSFESMDATEKDARRLEETLRETARVEIREVAGQLSAMWRVNSTPVTLPDVDSPLGEANETQIEFAFILTHYFNLVENGKIDGSLGLTAMTSEERIAVWSIDEQWVHQFYQNELTSEELTEEIRETRVDLS